MKKLKHYNYLLEWKQLEEKTNKEKHILYIQFDRSVILSLKKIENCEWKVNYLNEKNILEIKNKYNILEEDGKQKSKGPYSIETVKRMSMSQRNKLPIFYYPIIERLNLLSINKINLTNVYKKFKVFYNKINFFFTFYIKNIILPFSL